MVPLQRQRFALCGQGWSKLLFLAVELQACEQLSRFSLTLRWIGDRENEPDRAHSVISKNRQTPEAATEVDLDARDGWSANTEGPADLLVAEINTMRRRLQSHVHREAGLHGFFCVVNERSEWPTSHSRPGSCFCASP